MGAGVSAGMAVVAFTGDEFRLAVVVDILPGQGVALRKLLVDQVLAPSCCPIGLRLQLLLPVQSVAMAISPNNVVPAVFVEVENKGGAAGMRQVEIVVILP